MKSKRQHVRAKKLGLTRVGTTEAILAVHRSTIFSVCLRYGYAGIKFAWRAAARRFENERLMRIETAAGVTQRTN